MCKSSSFVLSGWFDYWSFVEPHELQNCGVFFSVKSAIGIFIEIVLSSMSILTLAIPEKKKKKEEKLPKKWFKKISKNWKINVSSKVYKKTTTTPIP